MSPHAIGTLLILGVAIGWASSWWWHPRQACKACKGAGRHFGKIFKRNYHMCATCNASGRETRPGTRAMIALGLIRTHPDRTGPGWNRRRRKERK